MTPTRRKKGGVNAASSVYREAFRKHCFELIHTGYRCLDPASLHDAEEPAVTGELIRAIQEGMDFPGCPEWYAQIAVKDNLPLNVSGKQGKNRPLVDMGFEHTSSRPRWRYLIEAKWVGKSKTSLGSVKGYLGSEGIGCFLSGKYTVDNQQAGMLAYVHSDDEATWAQKIQACLEKMKQTLKIKNDDNPVWKKDTTQEPFHAYISTHYAPAHAKIPLNITHLLLRFL